MAEDLSWVHQQAGMVADFQWQDEGTPATVDYTKVLGKLADGGYVVYVEATAESGFGYSYPVETHLVVRMGENGNPVIDNATDEQIKQVEE